MKIVITEEQKNNLFKPRNLSGENNRFLIWNKEQPIVDGESINQYDNEGKKQGKWIDYFDNGDISEVKHFKNNIQDGPTESYWVGNRMHSKGNWKNGLMDGKFHYYRQTLTKGKTGKLWCIDTYKQGLRQKIKDINFGDPGEDLNGEYILHDKPLEEGRVPRKTI